MLYSPRKRQLLTGTGCVDFTSGNLHAPGILNNQSFSLCAMVKQTTLIGSQWSMFGVDNGTSDFIIIISGSPNNVMDLKDPQGTTNLGTLVVGQWTFVGLTANATLATAYYRPAFSPTMTIATQSSTTAGSGDSVWISSNGFGFADFPGLISHVKGFNYTMTAEEMYHESLQLSPYSHRGNVIYLPATTATGAGSDGVLKGSRWITTGTLLNVRDQPPVPSSVNKKRLWFSSKTKTLKPDVLFYGNDA